MLCFVGNDFLKSRFFHGDIFINSHLWEGNYIICLCTVLSLVDKTFGLVLTDKTMTFYDRRKDNQLKNILQTSTEYTRTVKHGNKYDKIKRKINLTVEIKFSALDAFLE